MEKPDYTWLKAPRDAKGLSQEALAAELGVGDKTVRRWERCETGRKIPFARLAAVLGVEEHALKESQQSDWKAKTHYESQEELRKNVPPVPEKKIEKALVACDASGFPEGLRESLKEALIDKGMENNSLEADEVAATAEALAGIIADGDEDAFFDVTIQPLMTAIDAVLELPNDSSDDLQDARLKALEALRYFLDTVVHCCFIPLPKIHGGRNEINGINKAWHLRALLDASSRRKSLQYLNANTPERLNNDPESTHVLTLGDSYEASDDEGRVKEIVHCLGDWLMVTEPFEDSNYENYRETVDRRLTRFNYRDDNWAVLENRLEKEQSQEVRDLLLEALPALRMFSSECRDCASVRLNERSLEIWYAAGIYDIEEKRREIIEEEKHREIIEVRPEQLASLRERLHQAGIDSVEIEAILAAVKGGDRSAQTSEKIRKILMGTADHGPKITRMLSDIFGFFS